MLALLSESDYQFLPGRLRITIPNLRKNSLLETYLVKQMSKVPGVKTITASSLTGRALIYFDQARISLPVLCQEIENTWELFFEQQVNQESKYEILSLPKATSQIMNDQGSIKKLYVLATGGVLTGLLAKRMLVGRSPLVSSTNVFYLAALTTIIGSYPLLRRGVDTLARKKRINSDLLLFATTLVLLAMKESITGLSILGIVYLSDLFHHVMQTRSRYAISKMVATKELTARRLENGEARQVLAGDTVIVQAGERVPVAGESIAPMLTMVEQAAATRGALQQPEDYYAQKLMPLTMGIAAMIFLVTRNFYRALTVLLAGCPIAVSIAKNTALGTAVADAARKGIFVKQSRCLEVAGQTEVVLWDKTGTLTTGNPTITEVISLQRKQSNQEILLLVASAEQGNCHPLARMVVKEAMQKGLTLEPAESEVLVGYGVRSYMNQQEVLVGNDSLMYKEHIDIKTSKARVLRMKHFGNSAIYVAVDKKLVGLIGVKEHIRPESYQAIEQLRVVGIPHIGLITGDTANTGNAVADELGIKRYWSTMRPEDKIRMITQLRRKGYPVMMVGDGINDSPALAAADVGVTMADNCPELALRAANVVIAGDDPRKVSQMISIGKKTNQVIRQNLSFAVGVNVAGIALAAANIISPLAASLLLNVGTLGVIANSARLFSKGNHSACKQDKSAPIA